MSDPVSEIESLTRGLLQSLLQKPVLSAAAERIGVGVGLDGVLARIRIVGPAGPETLIAKWCDLASGTHEARFLRDQGPSLDVAVPRLLAFYAEPNRDRALLLLEDIAPADHCDVLVGIDMSRAESLLDAEARLHARFWERIDQSPSAWLSAWDHDMANRPGRTAECLPRFLASHGDLISSRARALAEQAAMLLPDAHAALRRAPVTLVHADLHAENVLFRSDGSPVILDWADVARGPAALDVARLLVEALTINQRRSSGDRLIGSYVRRIASLGVVGYGEDELRADVRQALIVFFAWSIRWVASDKGNDPAVPRVAALARNLALNAASALDDT